MKIIGHRGARGYEPENTLRSMKKAIDLGADMVEFDVYALPSGEVVVMHDHRVDRTTDGQGRVMDHSFEAIRRLDAGKTEVIPTLQEVLNLLAQRVRANIELKGPFSGKMVADIIDTYLQKGWAAEDFLVSSFDHHELRRFKTSLPQIDIAVLEHTIPINYASAPQELGAVSVNPNFEFISQAYVDDAHQRGLKVYPYTVNEEDDLLDMQKMGVDGVITDYPDRARTILLQPQRAKTGKIIHA